MKRNSKGQFERLEIKSGQIYYRWTVLYFSHKTPTGYFWICQCECGTTKPVSIDRVVRGDSKSCGCLRHNADFNKTHGLRNHPLYGVWRAMKGRCYNCKLENYSNYGGRGIIVCDRWVNSFQNFYNDMVEGYVKGEVAIDRIDPNGNYEPSNCRWLTMLKSANNKRTSKYLTLNGIVRTASEWGRYLGIKDDTIRHRKSKGYSDKDCLSLTSLPIRKSSQYNK